MTAAIELYISIINPYWTLRMKSLSLSDLNSITGMINGRTKMLIGKKVMVIPPEIGSKLELFLSLMIFFLLRAAKFLCTNLYLLMNMATNKLKSRMLNTYTNIVMNTWP